MKAGSAGFLIINKLNFPENKSPHASILIRGEKLELLPEKAIWWPGSKSLLLADLHFGKAGHFRKAGIPVPRRLEQEDLAVLSDLNHTFKPEKIYILGDMVHSALNADWSWLKLWREFVSVPEIHLILGNHDIIPEIHFTSLDIKVYRDKLAIGPFLLRHYPLAEGEIHNQYLLSGHLHPGVELRGKARQRLTLPCFYFAENQGILPAFGRFTGTSRIQALESDKVFAIMGGQVICV